MTDLDPPHPPEPPQPPELNAGTAPDRDARANPAPPPQKSRRNPVTPLNEALVAMMKTRPKTMMSPTSLLLMQAQMLDTLFMHTLVGPGQTGPEHERVLLALQTQKLCRETVEARSRIEELQAKGLNRP